MALSNTPDSKTVRLQQELNSTYTIIRRIGSGAMGEVYLANHKTLGGKWAIKVLADELARDPVIVERFIREAQIEANLQHPNIVKVIDIGTTRDFQFLVMPFVEGENLDERIRRLGVVDPAEAVTIASHVTRALECAHEHGIIHRDLKPANIRIDHYGTVVVMDFGIARVLDTTQGNTALGTRIGTPQYMSPEQSSGRPVDHRSDLYSLGVILYEMIAGDNPFYTDNPFAIGVRHLTVVPPPLSTVRNDLKPGLSEVVTKLLAKDPVERFQTASSVQEALSPFGGGIEIRTPMPLRQKSAAADAVQENLLKLGPLDAVLHRIMEPENARDLSADEKKLLEFIDGVRNVQEVLGKVPVEAEAAIAALESLQNDGFVYTEIPLFSGATELPPTILPPPRFRTALQGTPSPSSGLVVQKQPTPQPEAGVAPVMKTAGRAASARSWLWIGVALALALTGGAVWYFWPQEPIPIQVDAAPYAAVTIKTLRGDFLDKQDTPFRIELPPGTYIFEFVSDSETQPKEVKIDTESSRVIYHDFWREQKTDKIKQLLDRRR